MYVWFSYVSLAMLYAGLVAEAVGWHRLLKGQGIRASLGQSIISAGLSIFGKYVPGKLWSIVGRASYIAAKCEA